MTAKKSAVVEVEAKLVESTELAITSMQPGTAIEANFEALARGIASLIEIYQGVQVTPAYLSQAKKDRAYLNSLKASIDQRRKDIKQRYMAPVTAFEMQVKALLEPIETASAAIDVQVKALEEAERVAKRAELVKHYTEYAGILVDVVPFERVEAASWLNKTCNLMTAFEDIEHIVERIAKEEATLDELGLSHPAEAKATFFATLDMSAAIARSKAIDAQEEANRRFEAQKAEIAAAAETPVKVAEPSIADEVEQELEAMVDEGIVEPVRAFTFTVTCTESQKDGIKAYLQSVGIHGAVSR